MRPANTVATLFTMQCCWVAIVSHFFQTPFYPAVEIAGSPKSQTAGRRVVLGLYAESCQPMFLVIVFDEIKRVSALLCLIHTPLRGVAILGASLQGHSCAFSGGNEWRLLTLEEVSCWIVGIYGYAYKEKIDENY